MIPVTLFCKTCSCYFDTQAFEPEDLKNPVCDNCIEKRDCTHEHVRAERFDTGRCPETGYHDEGERLVCADCGEEVEEEPAPFCRHCFTDVDGERDLDRYGMCRGCASECAREFWMEHKECA